MYESSPATPRKPKSGSEVRSRAMKSKLEKVSSQGPGKITRVQGNFPNNSSSMVLDSCEPGDLELRSITSRTRKTKVDMIRTEFDRLWNKSILFSGPADDESFPTVTSDGQQAVTTAGGNYSRSSDRDGFLGREQQQLEYSGESKSTAISRQHARGSMTWSKVFYTPLAFPRARDCLLAKTITNMDLIPQQSAPVHVTHSKSAMELAGRAPVVIPCRSPTTSH